MGDCGDIVWWLDCDFDVRAEVKMEISAISSAGMVLGEI
jgi:hypothetical protein